MKHTFSSDELEEPWDCLCIFGIEFANISLFEKFNVVNISWFALKILLLNDDIRIEFEESLDVSVLFFLEVSECSPFNYVNVFLRILCFLANPIQNKTVSLIFLIIFSILRDVVIYFFLFQWPDFLTIRTSLRLI